MRVLLFLVLASGLTLALPAFSDDKSKQEKEQAEKAALALKQLAGRWQLESARGEGEDIDDEKGTEVVIEGDKLTMTKKGEKKKEEFTLKVYPSESPKGLDAIRTEDKYVFKFIYKVKDDTLKLCIWKAEPTKRALEFTGEAEHALVILKRPKS